MPNMNWLVAVLGVAFFFSMAYVSVTFFRVDDVGAKKGKKIISVVAGSASVYVSWQLITIRQPILLASITSVFLFAYAFLMFFSAKYTTSSRPLNFAMSKISPAQLVTHGPYRFVRHPFYSAYCAAWLASFIQLQNWQVATIFLVMVGLYTYIAFEEERAYMGSIFSERYMTYRANTGMLIPSITKLMR